MLRVIVAFGREGHEYRRFRQQGEEAVDARVKLTVRQTLFSLAVTPITAIGTALVLGFGRLPRAAGQADGRRADRRDGLHRRRLQAAGADQHARSAPPGRSSSACDVALDTARHRAGDRRTPRRGRRSAGRAATSTFEDVGFGYAGRTDTLKDISFEARAGAGDRDRRPDRGRQDDAVSLLPRFYDPAAGAILIDGADVRELTLAVAARADQHRAPGAAAVLRLDRRQHPLRPARRDRRRRSMEAAKAANAHDFIMRLPQGTRPSSASAARSSPAASGSASASRARSSRTRRS